MKNKKSFFLLYCIAPLLLSPCISQGQGINITSGGKIAITGAATIEINNGNFINNGTYTKGTETVIMSGSTAKTMSGTTNTDLHNLTITNTGGITSQIGVLTTRNITVNTGAGFIVDAGKACNVSNALSNSGTFAINSDATQNGSLIVSGTSTGNIIYNRYMSGNTWHLVSSPVGGSDINTSFMTANSIATNSGKYGLAPYNNSTPGWQHYTEIPAPSGTFIAGKGYEIMRASDGTVAFNGTVVTSDVGIGITENTNSWNLIGNPFTAAIYGNSAADETNNFISVNLNGLDASYGAIYVWDAPGSSYLTINQTSGSMFVAPGQSFFVYSKVGGSTMNFTEAMQTHQTGDIFKSDEIPTPSIKLLAERKEGTSSTNILYLNNMTAGLDPGYDAGRFSGGNNSFAVYTHLVGDNTNLVDFDIQCLPANQYDLIVPVGLNAPANTEIVFRAEITNMPSTVPVYLEDKLTNTFNALHEPGDFYKIRTEVQSKGTGRFYLHTKSSVTAIGSLPAENDFNIITHPENNMIRIIGPAGHNSTIAVYDMAGRKMLNRILSSSGLNDVKMDKITSGIYVVVINSPTQNRSKKISWIRND